MSEPDNAEERCRWMLSALADGEAAPNEDDSAFRAWREDVDARATWHAYQLIGDVLRSDDLAHRPGRDAALLQAVRARLATEPVVFAPAANDDAGRASERALASGTGTGGSRRLGGWARAHWQGPAAMAAGFIIVAGGLMVRPGSSDRGADAAAVAIATPPAVASAPALANASSEQLGPYLAAHRQWGGAAPIQMPDAGLRSVSLTQTQAQTQTLH